MKLSDLCTIRTNYPEANFWIVRRGSELKVGRPVREFNPEHIGVKVERLDLLFPDFLYYALMHIHQLGYWKGRANGTLSLVNIKVSDVRNIDVTTD